jgi:hypothetical protein
MAPMSPASAISSMSVYALEHQNGFTAFRNCANAASTSTGGLDGLGAATLDAPGAPGASLPPQPATLVTTAIPTTEIQILQKARRIARPQFADCGGADADAGDSYGLLVTRHIRCRRIPARAVAVESSSSADGGGR